MPNKHYLFGTAVFTVLIAAALGLAYITWQQYIEDRAERNRVAALARQYRSNTGGEDVQRGHGSQTTVSIYSEPSGAEVAIDGDSVGTTPLSNVPVSEVAFLLSIQKSRYSPVDTVVIPAEQEANTYSFVLESSSLAGSRGNVPPSSLSAPSSNDVPSTDGASRPGDSAFISEQPEEAPSETGDSPAQAGGTSNQPAPSDASEASPAPSEPAVGTLSVLVEPWGSIYIDGRLHKMDTDVLYTVQLPTGAHRVRVDHPALGTLNRPVEVTADTVQVVIDFNRTAELIVQSTPDSSEIYVNGRPTGFQTPSRLAMPVGRHVVGVRTDDEPVGEHTQVVILEEGSVDTVSFSMDGSPAADGEP